MKRRTFLLGTLAVAGCSGNTPAPQQCPPGTTGVFPFCAFPAPIPPPTVAGEWAVGPVISGVQYSVGMPPSVPDRWDFPVGPRDRIAYLTKPLSLAGKSKIRLEYTVHGSGPFAPTEGYPPLTYVCLYFQRNGDNWSGLGPYEAYRWWSNAQVDLTPGDDGLEVQLARDAWTSVTGAGNELGFVAAQNDSCCVGFTFGNAGGKGHGVYATAPGTQFEVRNYTVT